jgi:glycosyltransferase involved in cell wall biosynthesis
MHAGYSVKALKKVRIINLPEKGGKLIARNTGMQAAQGWWICWLDDDDEYSCRYLEYVNKFTSEKSGMSVCNFGMVRYWKGGDTDLIPPTNFKEVEFKSGRIATGTFAFKRECLKSTGYFPEATSPMMFAEMSGIPHYDGSGDGKVRPMGNPWGDDFWFFKQLLEHWQSFPLNAYLYFQHVGGGA